MDLPTTGICLTLDLLPKVHSQPNFEINKSEKKKGGVGHIWMEATGVVPEGRVSGKH